MNRKFCLLIMIFLLTGKFHSQISYSSWVNGYLQINSYQGNTDPNGYTMTLSGNGNFNIPNWKVTARLKSPITANNGPYTFPANKISFQPVSSTGQAYPNPVPTIAEIGIPPNTVVTEGSEFFLVPKSNAPLRNQPSQQNGYYSLQLKFSITVAGGAYLSNYPAWTTFNVPMEFTAYSQNNSIIGRIDHNIQFQIGTLSGTPPTSTELSLKVNGNATNGLLEFNSMQDYKDGKSVTYPNALTVKANTNFQITVKAIQSNFTSLAGKTIPVSNVQMNVTPLTQNAGSALYTVFLNTASQTIAKGSSTQGANLDYTIKYSTKPNDEYFINAKPDEYSATLQYEITPQ
ncbi:hypothetical protein HIO71_08660 [Chryseobacterium aquaticum]|uniref:Uncharacterized protein n=1 Tax=Chryseobacterium aquaticum TaxID=452084 RepID=A0A848N7E6_9FLAO|nr:MULTISPECIES: hypothetical protein [Chryseobacterium]NMR34279.1 hypothetical protein [Chryseobacterium aquaticum]NRQ46352.1 hypothetical protein [Chryseobacterium sp. C-204]